MSENEDKSKKAKIAKLVFYSGWIIPALAAVIVQRVISNYPVFVERYYTGRVFYYISWPFIRISSLVPFSLTELLVVLIIPVLLIFLLVRTIIRIVKNRERLWHRFAGGLARVMWLLTVMLVVFMLMHGLNYARLPVAESFGLPVRDRSAQELAEAAVWLAEEAAILRDNLEEDANGVFTLSKSTGQTMKDVNDAYQAAMVDWPQLKGHYIRPKGVVLSHYWSYTGITGVYNPWLVEANINIDQPDYAIPDTIAHEVAHTRGFAREDEANFISFLTGMYAENQDYRYSVLLHTWIRVMNRLYSLDREAYTLAAGYASDAMNRDMAFGGDYWRQFEGLVQEASTQVNNAFLQANMQTDGVQSYGRMIDLVLAWYEAGKIQ